MSAKAARDDPAVLPHEAIKALCDLYLKYWHDTGGYEADDPKYTLTPNDDLADLEEICVRIEPHEMTIRAVVAEGAS